MPRVLCTLPNASANISGVAFTAHEKGMLSEEITTEQAEAFASIPGYDVVGAKLVAPPAPPGPTDAEVAARAALIARAEKVNLKVKGNWSVERLTSEVEAAEKAATAPVTTPAAGD